MLEFDTNKVHGTHPGIGWVPVCHYCINEIFFIVFL